jgi:hypothetical protein
LESLADPFAVDLRHRVHDETARAQRLGHREPPKTAVDEELGCSTIADDYPTATGRFALGSGPCSYADHVFDLVDRHGEVVRDIGDRVAGEEPVDEVLHASAAVGEDR